MFVGHLGLAQSAKALRRQIPLTWLVVAAYLPDLFRLPLGAGVGQSKRDFLSHSLLSILVLAIGIGVLWIVKKGRYADAAVLSALCVLHWPTDVLTGCKPTWVGGPWLGAFWYRHPVSDLFLEIGLFLAG